MGSQTSTANKPETNRSNGNMPTSHNQDPKLADIANDAMDSFRVYAKKRPEVVAIWCLGVGFVLGWKLKPW